MTDAVIIKQIIDDFLSQKIHKDIEQKQKQAKGNFSEVDKQKIRDEHEIVAWLDKVAENTHKVFLNVSHIAKLTHSSSRAMSLRDVSQSDKYPYLITTQSVGGRFLDNGYLDANVARIADFLTFPVKDSKKQLGNFLAEDASFFAKITDDKEKQAYWSSQIKKAYQSQQICSHTLAKQIYIPMGNNHHHDYHLVSPMYSSSLAHEIALAIKASNDKTNQANLARKQNAWSDQMWVFYPNVATLGVTKSNHQNVSILNGQRNGQLYLFAALPPKWTVNPNPPTSMTQILRKIHQEHSFFKVKYLLNIFKKNDLFINYERKLALKTVIEDIIYAVCDELLFIRKNQPVGWTKNHEIPPYLSIIIDGQPFTDKKYSQPQIELYLDELKQDMVAWISKGVGDENRTKSLENLWLKIMTPILKEFYQVLKAE